MTSFERDGDVVVLRLHGQERTVLASLAAGLAEMLEPPDSPDDDADPLAAMVGMTTGPVGVPADPALRRLLPDAYDDPEGAAEFRRLTDASLRQDKVANLRRIVDGAAAVGGVVRLASDDVGPWLSGLNDIRLVLGERLDMTEERKHLEGLDDDDPRLPLLAAYDWLSELQEMVIYLVSGEPD
jgi:hypothetical protein